MEWEKAFVQTVSDNAVPPKSSFTETPVMMMINPIKPSTFGPFNTHGGQICPRAFSCFPELLEGVTCSKKNLQLSSHKNLQFKTHFRCLSHLVPKILLF